MPQPREMLSAVQKDGKPLIASEIYERTWNWLNERGCANIVSPQVLERYAMSAARWVQCEAAITEYGFLAKHPTTGNAIQSPYVAMSQNYMAQTNRLWYEIFQIVKENCAADYTGANPQDDVMANDASIYVFHADTEGLNFRRAFSEAGFYLSGTCIWKKQSLVLGRSPYQWRHEPVLFGWKKKGKHEWYADRKQTTIWEFDKPKQNADHPTMKPVELLAYPILNSSMANCVVLDPFGGSGSTLIACEQTDRVCRMIELDEKYCDVIVRRTVEQLNGSDDVFLIRNGVRIPYKEIAENTDN